MHNQVFCLSARRLTKRAAEFTGVNEQRSKSVNDTIKQKTPVMHEVY